VSPFLATENRFALVQDERYIGLTDTIVLFENNQPESLKYLLGLLNSRLLTLRFRSIGKLKGGGIYEYFWNSVSKLPIRRIDFSKPADKARHDKLVALVDKMLALVPKLRAAKSEAERKTLQNAMTATDQQIDALVYDLYGLTAKERELVQASQPSPDSYVRPGKTKRNAKPEKQIEML
jgi:Xaa-Pro aminopeptidase